MKDFELKKVKRFPEMSEETECFVAQLWVDGKHIADVRNDGKGGSNDLHPMDGYTYEDIKEFDTLDAECEIFEKVIEYDEVRKLQSNNFVVKKDRNLYTLKFPMSISKLKKIGNYDMWLNNKLDNFKKHGYVVLNTNL